LDEFRDLEQNVILCAELSILMAEKLHKLGVKSQGVDYWMNLKTTDTSTGRYVMMWKLKDFILWILQYKVGRKVYLLPTLYAIISDTVQNFV